MVAKCMSPKNQYQNKTVWEKVKNHWAKNYFSENFMEYCKK